jgi:hypothetical protein
MQKLIGSLIVGAACGIFAASCVAQECCQEYRLVPEKYFEEEQVTTYKLQKETHYETRKVTTYKPVVTTEMRRREYTVAKPVIETSEREEKYTVLKPVWETSYRDEVHEETSYQTETKMRVEQYVVRKPVWKTEYREERQTVRRPVTETYLQSQQVTTYKPVTSVSSELVDQGGFTNNIVYQPTVRNRLQFTGPQPTWNPNTGLMGVARGGLRWVPTVGPGNYYVQPQYVPNIVEQQTYKTSLIPETVTVERPVEFTKYVDQVITRKVPVQTMETVEEYQERRIPVTVQKPVTTQVVKKVPVRTMRWQEQVVVKKVPVQRTTYKYETKVEEYPVKIERIEPHVEYVEQPTTVYKTVPVITKRVVEKTRLIREPIMPVYVEPVCPTVISSPIYSSSLVNSSPVINYVEDSTIEVAKPAVTEEVIGSRLEDIEPGVAQPDNAANPLEPEPDPENGKKAADKAPAITQGEKEQAAKGVENDGD